jgi:hypothetical protein
VSNLVNSQITDFLGASTSLVSDAPPVVNSGDILVLTGQINNGGTAATFTRADWNELEDFGDAFGIGGFAYWKTADGTEGGTTVTVTSSQSVTGHGQMFVVENTGGLDDYARKVSDDTGTTEAPTAIDCTGTNQLVVQVIHMRRSDSATNIPTEPSGTTDAPGDAPLGTNFRQVTAVAEYDEASSGAAVTSTATWGNLVDGEPRTLYTFSFLNVAAGDPEGQLVGGKLISGLLAGVLVN